MGYWKYEIVHDYNATKLIKEFREANSKLKNSAGTEDEELDFIMYAEKDDITISLGRVLLIKMSDAMVSYYHEYKQKQPDFDLSKYWATHIHKQSHNVKTFHFREDEIAEAFHESVKLQTKKIKDVSVLDAENYIKKVLEKLSESFRKEEKFSREQWDPTLKSDQYLFKKPDEAVQVFIEKCNATQKRLKDFKNQLEVFQSFNIAGFKGKIELVENTVKFLDESIENIEELKKHLTENRNEARFNIAYLCGIWGGSVEFIAGFLDIALLAIRILITDAINDTSEINTNLDLLEMREGLEEILGAIVKDPKEVFSEIIKGISNYKYSRYDDPKLNDYQLQYNEGEDTVLAIDLIIAIVTIIRGIAKLAKLLPKFTKWIDDVLARNGRGAKKLKQELEKIIKTNSRKHTQKDIDELAKIRKIFNAGKNKNVAFTRGEIGGKKIDLISRSGAPKDHPKQFDNFKQIDAENYHYKDGPIPDYINHTEQKQIEYLYEMFKNDKTVSGKIEIVSDLKICDNCNDIIKKFKIDFPNIDVVKVWVKDKL